MAIYQVIRRDNAGGSSILDSGFGASDWARIGRDKHFAEELETRLEKMGAQRLEHDLKIKARRNPDTLTLLEDCGCDVECRPSSRSPRSSRASGQRRWR